MKEAKNPEPASGQSAEEPVSSVEPGKIYAYVMPGADPDVAKYIRPCRPRRAWMDATPAHYGYRCTPLSAANTLGWEILNPVPCEFIWNGMTPPGSVFVYREREHRFAARSHFGTGTVTWDVPFLFRTPPEYGMVVTGPANFDKDGIVPLEGFVRTDWLPFTFSMSWRLTTPQKAVRFEEGEPICRIYPYPINLPDEMEIELRDLDEHPDFKRRVYEWQARREENYRKHKEISERWAQGGEPELQPLFNRAYAKGQGSEELGDQEHQTTFKCQEVVDKRKR